jgi:hypothetical protein
MQEEEENLLQEFSLAPGLRKVISVYFQLWFSIKDREERGEEIRTHRQHNLQAKYEVLRC